MSTEEQNRPTAPEDIPVESGSALPDDVKRAAEEAVTFQLPPGVSDARARAFNHNGAGVHAPDDPFAALLRTLKQSTSNPDAPQEPANSNDQPRALTLVSNRDDVEMEALEAERLEKIADIDSALNHADDDSRPKLEALRELLKAVKGGNADSIRSAIANATSTLSREAAGGGKAAGGNDPQERLDRAWEKIGELNKKIDTNFQKLDRYLTVEEKAERKKRDEEVEKRKAELERLKNSGASAEEILRAQQALIDAEKRRTEYGKTITDRIRNDPNTSPEDKKTADANARLLEEKLKELEKAQQHSLRIYEQRLQEQGASPEDIARLQTQRQQFFNQQIAVMRAEGNLENIVENTRIFASISRPASNRTPGDPHTAQGAILSNNRANETVQSEQEMFAGTTGASPPVRQATNTPPPALPHSPANPGENVAPGTTPPVAAAPSLSNLLS